MCQFAIEIISQLYIFNYHVEQIKGIKPIITYLSRAEEKFREVT